MKILNIQAHPDDAEVHTGATIAKFAARGDRVEYLICTKGNRGTYDRKLNIERLAEIRRAEVGEAARILGVRQIHFLDGEDGFLYPSLELRGRIMEVIRKVQPEIVMTLDPCRPYEMHPDHLTVGRMAAEAAVFAGFPHFYPEHLRAGLEPCFVRELWLYYTHEPNHYEDVAPFMEKKIVACFAHESQVMMAGFQKKQVRSSEESAEELGREEFRRLAVTSAENAGRRRGCRYAEEYKRFEVRPGHLLLD